MPMSLSPARRWIVAALCVLAVPVLVFLPGASVGHALRGRSRSRPVARSLRLRLQRGPCRDRADVLVVHAARRQARVPRRAGFAGRCRAAREPGSRASGDPRRPGVRPDRARQSQRVVDRGTRDSGRARHTHAAADRPSVVTVGSLDIVNLDALVTTSSSLRLTVRGLSASLRGGGPGRLAGEVRADRGILLEGEGVTGVLDRVTADVAVGDGALAIRSLIAESGGGDLRLNGRVTFSDGGGYDLKYRSTIELGELRKWWGRAPPAAGRVGVTGSVGGALTDPRVTFDLRARELAVGAISDGRLDATGRASAGGIVVETCSLQSAEGLFNGHGRLALGDGDGPSLLAGEWSLPSLRALARPLDLHPSSLPALPVSGTANLSWVGSAPAIGTLSGDLRGNLRTPGAGALTVDRQGWALDTAVPPGARRRNRRGAPPGDGTPCGRSATVEAERTCRRSFGGRRGPRATAPRVGNPAARLARRRAVPAASQPAAPLAGRSSSRSWTRSSRPPAYRRAVWTRSKPPAPCTWTGDRWC